MKENTEVWKSFDYTDSTCCFDLPSFLVLIAYDGYMQITHQAYYTDRRWQKLRKRRSNKSVRGQIYDS